MVEMAKLVSGTAADALPSIVFIPSPWVYNPPKSRWAVSSRKTKRGVVGGSHEESAMESTVDCKATRVSAVVFLILLAAPGAAAQRPSNGQPLAPAARPQTPGAELSLDMSGRGSLIVRVVGAHNAP